VIIDGSAGAPYDRGGNGLGTRSAPGQDGSLARDAVGARRTTTIFALYASERNWLSLSQGPPWLGGPVVGTLGWEAFLALTPAAECGIIVVPNATTSRLYEDLRVLRCVQPFLPLVLIAEQPLPRDIDLLGEVIPQSLVALGLLAAIQRACTRALLHEAATHVESVVKCPATLRRAFMAACRAPAPIATVKDLARVAGCHRHTLWSQWHKSALAARELKLEDFVNWLILLHACIHWSSGLRWNRIAATCGVHRHRLRRISAKYGGATLCDFSPNVCVRLRAAFRRTVLAPAAVRTEA
jgi:hypothetical protein